MMPYPFSSPALARRPGRPYRTPDPLRPITEGQARRLFAIACRDNVYAAPGLARALRYYGFYSAERVRSGAYDRLCEIAADPIAAQLFNGPDPLPGERPWLVSEADEGAFLRGWAMRQASDDFLQRQVATLADFALCPSGERSVGAEVNASVLAALREIRYRMAARSAVLASIQAENSGQDAQPGPAPDHALLDSLTGRRADALPTPETFA